MNLFAVKKVLAYFLDITGGNTRSLKKVNREFKNAYIRVVNYHGTPEETFNILRKQISWYKKEFEVVSFDDLKKLINDGEYGYDKPGILLTFDDGIDNNFEMAKRILATEGIKGVFFVSSKLVGQKGYMTSEELVELEKDGHTIGCHTSNHHRMNEDDNETILNEEICESKAILEEMLSHECECFCWCGGEEIHYTKAAADKIKASGYKYSFMTNSYPLTKEVNPYQIQRTNVDAAWNISLVRFQLGGYQDKRYAEKRNRVNILTK